MDGLLWLISGLKCCFWVKNRYNARLLSGSVAQWQSRALLMPWLEVRVLPESFMKKTGHGRIAHGRDLFWFGEICAWLQRGVGVAKIHTVCMVCKQTAVGQPIKS